MNFQKVVDRAKALGAISLSRSNRKYKKYVVTLENGKKVHFDDNRYEDFTTHHDEGRRYLYRLRASRIVDRYGRQTINNIESPNYCSDYYGSVTFRTKRHIYLTITLTSLKYSISSSIIRS